MKRILNFVRVFFLLGSVAFLATIYTGAYFSDNGTSVGNSFTAATWTVTATSEPTATATAIETATSTPIGNIVLNELMINPIGDAETEKTAEWVELYNNGTASVDVNGWYLYDAFDSHALQISSTNVTGGSTSIAAGGFLVVNRGGDEDFSLNNGSDAVRLYNGTIYSSTLIDSFSYTSNTTEDKTWAKFPNGSGSWQINREPTPGGPNV